MKILSSLFVLILWIIRKETDFEEETGVKTLTF